MKKKGKKKKSQLVKSCCWVGPSCVFNYKNAIELWVMETENSQKVFSVSITYNSKIRELSDGNKKLETELWLAKQNFFWELRWIPLFLRIELWKLRIEWWELPIQTTPQYLYLCKTKKKKKIHVYKQFPIVWNYLRSISSSKYIYCSIHTKSNDGFIVKDIKLFLSTFSNILSNKIFIFSLFHLNIFSSLILSLIFKFFGDIF